ncbi:MAG TPA: hypothetical protein VFU57_02455 [Candidatus Acidoferrales bacterium]|nr:hypothetical protein [Candidatus Acidoferrales bacterium]
MSAKQNEGPSNPFSPHEAARSTKPNLRDPQVVLALLEADQVVAAKQASRFGRKKLSLKMRVILWGLRIYLVIMLVIVAISVMRALHGDH